MRTAAVLVVVLSLLVSAWAIAALTVNIQVALPKSFSRPRLSGSPSTPTSPTQTWIRIP